MAKAYASPRTIAFVGVCLLLCIWFILRHGQGIKIDNINDEDFRQEVGGSDVPVLVIVSSAELWNRTLASTSFSTKQVCPAILAVKQIIKEEKYKDKVRFWKYMVPDGSYNRQTRAFDKDPLCRELDIRFLPTLLIVTNGRVAWRGEGGGCTKEDTMKAIEKQLKGTL